MYIMSLTPWYSDSLDSPDHLVSPVLACIISCPLHLDTRIALLAPIAWFALCLYVFFMSLTPLISSERSQKYSSLGDKLPPSSNKYSCTQYIITNHHSGSIRHGCSPWTPILSLTHIPSSSLIALSHRSRYIKIERPSPVKYIFRNANLL